MEAAAGPAVSSMHARWARGALVVSAGEVQGSGGCK